MTHLSHRIPSLRCDLRRERVRLRRVWGVRVQSGSRGRWGGDSGTSEYNTSLVLRSVSSAMLTHYRWRHLWGGLKQD